MQENGSTAVEWYRKAAEQGHVEAQWELGGMYEGTYRNVKRDFAETVKWYRKAAEQGQVEAQGTLGGIYKVGRGGVKQDYVEAAKWYKKAAEQGHNQAKGAFHILSRIEAAEQGNSIAQYELGNMYNALC